MTAPKPWILTLSESSFLRRIEGLGPRARRGALWLRMEADPEFFARQLFPAWCRLPFAAHHRVLFDWHREMGREPLPGRRGLRHVLAAPRGAAKSTVASLILPLHDLLFRRERYIVLLSATERQAQQRLRAIRSELLAGEAAHWLAMLPDGAEPRLTSSSLTAAGVQIDAFGAGTEIRGIGTNGFRPTKILLDDAEASRTADSPRAREKLADWFGEVVEHLGDRYTHMLAVGTVLHEKGLIASLLQRPDFVGHRARSIERFSPREDLWGEWRRRLMDFNDPARRASARDFFESQRAPMTDGTEVLWPEKEDYEELMAQLTLQGRRAFYQEKQNTPLGPEEALFEPARALRAVCDGSALVLQTVGGEAVRRVADWATVARRFAYLDAALGKGRSQSKGDFAALAVVVLLPDGSLVLESLWARRASPTEQIRRLFDLHEKAPFERLAVEGTGFQELLLLPIEEERKRRRADGRRADLPVEPVHPKRTKSARIAALEPLLANGTLALAPDLDEEWWEELSTWPRSRHDDALDAAAGAIELVRSGSAGTQWESVRPGNAMHQHGARIMGRNRLG